MTTETITATIRAEFAGNGHKKLTLQPEWMGAEPITATTDNMDMTDRMRDDDSCIEEQAKIEAAKFVLRANGMEFGNIAMLNDGITLEIELCYE